jgi:hypothetical protein
MFQIKKNLFALVVVATALSATPAFAIPGVDLGVMGGASMGLPSTSGVDGKIGLSAGASLGLGPIEASVLYSQYKAGASILGNDVSYTLNYLDVPVLFRMGVGPISLGVGGFYSMFLNGSASAAGESNYGATASLRFTVPVVGFFVDGRYNLGLKDNSGEKLSGAALLLGFNFL